MFRNYMAREMAMKIVFVGPAKSGKKAAMNHFLQWSEPRGKVQWSDEAWRMIQRGIVWFDFIPKAPATVDGFPVRLFFYTLQNSETNAEALIDMLTGTDAIVFVADSQRSRQAANIEAMRTLEKDFLTTTTTAPPIALLYNKRDLTDVASVDEMNAALNPGGLLPFAETVATEGRNVGSGMKPAIRLCLERYREASK